ncbi:hypothetical protein CSC3H3_12045 [Thalassospira marina]|uniref:diguanylate cyclase n=2 Tax=Thalassospira marina TaxID=2048283 RepID=A0ABM6Q9X9_9PROT|nr:hypothetical protein CSC3H3_12045 [Thalassospira marina]
MMMKKPHNISRLRRFLDEDFLSVFLSIGLLLGILFMLGAQTLKEHHVARDKALDTTDFAIATYADNLSVTLLKADGVALIATRAILANQPVTTLEDQLAAIIQDDRDLVGYIQLDASGNIVHEFTFQGLNAQNLPTAAILARHRDSWQEPALRASENVGMKAGYVAIERGMWAKNGTFSGVVIVLVRAATPYEDTPLERFLAKSKTRISTYNNVNLTTESHLNSAKTPKWLSEKKENAFWAFYYDEHSMEANSVTILGDFVLGKRNIPGLPVTIYMQVPVSEFMDAFEVTRRSAIIASIVVVAVTLFLFLQIRIDRRAKRRDARRRNELDKRLQFALDSTGQGLWDWDFEKQKGYFSSNLYGLLALPQGEICLTFESFADRIHPDDRELFSHTIDEHIVGSKPVFEIEVRMQAGSTGQWVWFQHSGSVIEWGDDDHPKRMIGLLKNVHQQKLRRIELEFEASHDPLTGLFNRAAFEDRVARIHAQTRRIGTPYSMIMLDVDHFKRVNDTYGHNCGDIVLKNVASLALGCLRFEEEKLFFRLGGEEFVILLPHSDSQAGVTLAERIRRKIENSPIQAGKHRIKITLSAGVATNQDDEDPLTTLKRADWALYEAKETGRNRVCHATGTNDVAVTSLKDAG